MALTPKSLARLQQTNALRSELVDALERHAELLMRLNEELERYCLHVETAHLNHAALVRRVSVWVARNDAGGIEPHA